jgi:hypothetical protein
MAKRTRNSKGRFAKKSGTRKNRPRNSRGRYAKSRRNRH